MAVNSDRSSATNNHAGALAPRFSPVLLPPYQGGLGGSTQLAIEIDGDSHFQDGAQEYDRERQAFIESAGIRFLRFTNNDVYRNLESVLEIITKKVRELR